MIDSWLLNWRLSDQLTLLTQRPIFKFCMDFYLGNHRINSIVLRNIRSMILVNVFEVSMELISHANSSSNMVKELQSRKHFSRMHTACSPNIHA